MLPDYRVFILIIVIFLTTFWAYLRTDFSLIVYPVLTGKFVETGGRLV